MPKIIRNMEELNAHLLTKGQAHGKDTPENKRNEAIMKLAQDKGLIMYVPEYNCDLCESDCGEHLVVGKEEDATDPQGDKLCVHCDVIMKGFVMHLNFKEADLKEVYDWIKSKKKEIDSRPKDSVKKQN